MKEIHFSESLMTKYAQSLYREEKSRLTVKKYVRDVRRFARHLDGRHITK